MRSHTQEGTYTGYVQTDKVVRTLDAFLQFPSGCNINDGLGMAVDQVRVCAMGQQQGAHLNTRLGSCLMQWGKLPQVHCIHTRTSLTIIKEFTALTDKSTHLQFMTCT